ncbi:MAG TPA: diaminopimelate epimerase [SAR86 cluster bacterium]|nr:diaminopimelate epimerase [SAR86 cluster bacterium]
MALRLYIYSGLGNVIALVDLLRNDLKLTEEDVLKISKSKNVEFDQLITILPPKDPDIDLSVEIYNTDGSVAENCINGARCLTKFVVDEGLIAKKYFSVSTLGGLWNLKAHENGDYSVKFPYLQNLKAKNTLPPENSDNKHLISIEGHEIELGLIDLGNPHAVTFKELNDGMPLRTLGEALQNSNWFPEGVNVGVGKIISNNEIDLKVYERGAGETLACGSGACAAALIAIEDKVVVSPVKVNFEKGSLFIDYNIEDKEILVKGGAEFIKEINVMI